MTVENSAWWMLSDDAEAMSLTMGNAFHVVTKPRDTTPEDKPAISLPTIATFLFGKNIVIDIFVVCSRTFHKNPS